MSITVHAPLERRDSTRTHPAREPAHGMTLDLVTAWRALPGALMVLGWAPAAIPASGSVQLRRQKGARGIFRSVSWPGSRPNDGHAFLMAIRLPAQAEPLEATALMLRGGDVAMSLVLPSEFARDPGPGKDASLGEGPGFGQQVARLARSHSAEVARFMLDVLRPSHEGNMAHAIAMIRAFLTQAGQADGCVELMTAVPDGFVLLQGWGIPLHGKLQVILAGQDLPCFEGHAGEFMRPDITAPASGVMLMLPSASAPALAHVEQVFVLSDAGVHTRALVEHRLLDSADSVAHIRHMMPSLRGPAPVLAILKETMRARFEGYDTLLSCPHPVRAAVDTALASPSAGVFLSGWVYDPARLITALHLRGTAGYAQRLDETWTRVLRQDVLDAFTHEPGFPPALDAEAGFAASSAIAPAPGEPLYLQFTFAQGEPAFVPLVTADPGDEAVCARLLDSVDLYKPSGVAILERHVAPLVARARPDEPAPAQVFLRGPLDRAHAIVVPLTAPVPPRALIAGFLHDPALPTEQLVLVCGPRWGHAELDGLRGMLRFYGLPATVLVSGAAASAPLALREAARVTTATLLVQGPGVIGAAPGWRAALRRVPAQAAVAGTIGFACPTLLYEDWSIRYAGSPDLRFQDAAPYTSAHAPLAGLSATLAAGQRVQRAALGTLECCLVLPAALIALDRCGTLSTDAARDIAFFTRLQAAGIGGVWAPAIQVYAPETAHLEPSRAATLVDGWVLRETCRLQKEG